MDNTIKHEFFDIYDSIEDEEVQHKMLQNKSTIYLYLDRLSNISNITNRSNFMDVQLKSFDTLHKIIDIFGEDSMQAEFIAIARNICFNKYVGWVLALRAHEYGIPMFYYISAAFDVLDILYDELFTSEKSELLRLLHINAILSPLPSDNAFEQFMSFASEYTSIGKDEYNGEKI